MDNTVCDLAPRNTLTVEDILLLEAPVGYEEVNAVVMGFHPDKSPGPDGFPARFYQTFWQVVDKNVVAVVQNFFSSGTMPLGISSCFLTLLPKVGNASKVGEFRPIALCNLVYKIITKLMANRLALLLPKLVGVEQCAFVKDDLLVACQASIHNARVLFDIFKKFECFTGLQVSPSKSSVLFSRAVRRKTALLECWNVKLLSVTGKVELIKAVVTPIFQYWCSIFDVPVAVINQIQILCRDFLWGSKEHANKLHLMKWDMITRPKDEGGLGIRKLMDIQVASKCVLVWDFLTSKDRLWISWFQHKYSSKCNYWSAIPRMSSSVVWKSMLSVRDIMLQHCEFQIDTGHSFLLFKDPWCAGQTVVAKFGHRMIRSLQIQRDAPLSSLIQKGAWDWQLL
ncbi:uncharacterized protein LOC132296338 [Cornus florida]|uniref:uncharacterized protein LOC132296338 n=1 Tax=Cornus florida TaxID=4283 RepID=UPI0028A235AC|nr:uncharacterized protein LOC132296338 [Cornus florida]